MSHFFALGFEVALEGGFDGDLGGEALDDLDAGGFEGGDLLRVVGEEADLGDAEVLEDGGGELEVAAVGLEAKLEVGFDGVEALVLQLVGAELGHEADATALLLLVEQDSGALFGDTRECEVELVVAVAAERVEDVAGGALGVDANDGRLRMNVAHDEGDGALERLAVGFAGLREAFEAEDTEVTPAGGEVGIRDLRDAYERHSSIIDSRGWLLDS